MAKVPRHEFVPVEIQPYAYLNRPLPIGFDKTISQPLIVAVMTDLLELKPDDLARNRHRPGLPCGGARRVGRPGV
jgi:protein-L-isoaspartate O-methyltransferase